MTESPTLYSFRRCPYAMRARMALLMSGAAFAIREVVLRDKPAALIAASPKATVPVLVLADEHVIDESLDIMRWALSRDDPEQWLTGDDAALIQACDDRFKHDLDRYKYADRHDADPIALRSAGLVFLMDLERRLEGRSNLCGDARRFTDIAIMPFVRQFAAVDRAWFDGQALPNVRLWLERHIGSDLFTQAMMRLKPWRAGDAEIVWTGTRG